MTGKCLTGVLLLASAGAVHGGEVFHWKGGSGEWLDWGETSSWETSAGGVMTDATRLPGADDAIYYPNPSMYTDLGGQSWSIGSYSMNATPRTNTCLMLTNGTLTVTSAYNVYAGIHEVFDGGTFVIAPTVANMYESQYNAGHLAWTVHSGGRLDITPKTIDYFQGYTTIASRPRATLVGELMEITCYNVRGVAMVGGTVLLPPVEPACPNHRLSPA